MRTISDYEQILSSISHEVRNPITLINSYLQLMESVHPEVRSFAQWSPIQKEIKYLCRLLEDVSAFHNSEKLHLTLTDSTLWLSQYALTAEHLVQTLGNTNITLIKRWSPSLPVLALDTVKIRQVLDNLIRNSIEATVDTNTITLSASTLQNNLVIEVSDTGCGIRFKDLSSIFDPFVTHKPQGNGLGLAISKRIIQAHGGDITAYSFPGQGTVFTILLPIRREL